MPVSEYLLDYLIEKASAEVILAFELPEELQKRGIFLIEKRRSQTLAAEEAQELVELLETEALVATLQARAFQHQELVENFKQSWREVKQGKTHPISELWDGI